MENKNTNKQANETESSETNAGIAESITSKSGLILITVLIVGIIIIFSFVTSNKQVKNSSANLADITPPVVKGLYVGMSVDNALRVINRGLKQHLFLSDEFMYNNFTDGSSAYKDAATLRKNIKFLRQKNDTYLFGGSFSFGYKSSNIRSGYTSVYKIISKDTKLYSDKQSFGAGITLKADHTHTVYSILLKPIFLKSAFGLVDIDEEEFISQFVSKHKLDTLSNKVNGPFTGDSSMSYTYTGKNGFRVTIDDDMTILMHRIMSE
ncbi:MAG: hypothetical protein HQL71_07695 [Magnetococcales bacterium]|nr:hypothetical protein [Magnetococcales bacterium]